MPKSNTDNLLRYAEELGLEIIIVEPQTTEVSRFDEQSGQWIDVNEPTLTERAMALTARKDELIRKTLSILQADLSLKDYEAEELRRDLNRDNFSEFWFPGTFGGSLKVFLDGRGTPFVYDQYQNMKLVEQITETNAKLRALFA
jgi:hypothetical protein